MCEIWNLNELDCKKIFVWQFGTFLALFFEFGIKFSSLAATFYVGISVALM